MIVNVELDLHQEAAIPEVPLLHRHLSHGAHVANLAQHAALLVRLLEDRLVRVVEATDKLGVDFGAVLKYGNSHDTVKNKTR